MIEVTVALVVFLFPLAYSPGPGNMFFAANGARYGFRATARANGGYHVATWLVTVAIGFGFAAAMKRSPELFTIISRVGSVYVLWLAWKLFRSGALDGVEEARPAGFFSGVTLLILNPKAYVIITLMFSQFLIGSNADSTAAVIWISTVFTLNNLVAFAIWTAIGDQIATRFRETANARKLNMVFGAVLAAVAFWMMADHSPPL